MEKKESTPTRPPNPAMPYREDCWSEGETSALVDAWGDRYIELNRGNLRQKQWREVANAVNSRRRGGRRPNRTDVQCKNRIDTLKKKLKAEKSRMANGGGESQWPFFARLDDLVGSGQPHSSKKPSASPPLAHPLPFRRKGSPLPIAASAVRPAEPREKRSATAAAAVDNAFFRRAAAAAAAAAAENIDDPEEEEEEDEEEEEEEEEEEKEEEGLGSLSRSSSRSGRGLKRERDEEGCGIRELAKAIRRFAEIYERVEESKQRQMIELEKQRTEFAKALEFQKMQIIVDSQVQLAKMKRAKRSDNGNYP